MLSKSKTIGLARVFIVDDGSVPIGFSDKIESTLENIGFSCKVLTLPREQIEYELCSELVLYSNKRRKPNLYLILVSESLEDYHNLAMIAQRVLSEDLDRLRMIYINPLEMIQAAEKPEVFLTQKIVKAPKQVDDPEELHAGVFYTEEGWGIGP